GQTLLLGQIPLEHTEKIHFHSPVCVEQRTERALVAKRDSKAEVAKEVRSQEGSFYIVVQ
ncbi:hypothetical protein KUCAC02_023681, partial [Chaenocephalus aceratus]